MELSASKALAIRMRGVPVLLLGMPGDCRVHPLDRERLVIGSDLGVDVHLKLPGVAPRHLMLQRGPDGFEFFDLSGSEGALLNGCRSGAGALVHADELAIGSAHLVMIDPEADSMPPGLQLLGLPVPLLREEAARENEVLARSGETFHDLLIENLRRMPWLLVSGALHALIWISLLALLDAGPPGEDGLPELAVDMRDEAEILDVDEIAEEIADYEPELDEPIEDEPVEIDEAVTPTPSLEDEIYDDDPGEPEAPAGLGMNRRAMGDAGEGRGLGGPGGLGAVAGGKVERKISQLRHSGLDLVIVLDTTSSMDKAIRAAKEQVGTFIATLEGLGIEFRLGVVAFRDRGENEDYLTIEEELTNRVYKAVDFIDRLDTGGGGNFPEAVYDALQAATSMRFGRKAEKILVLVGDAPPHRETYDRIADLLARFQDKGGLLHTIYVETGMGGDGRPAMRDLAERGGGHSVDLRQARMLVRDVLAVTLGSDSNADVEALLTELDNGRSSDAIRRRLKQKDPAFVELMLRSRPLNPRLPLELGRHNDLSFVPAYLEVLRDGAVKAESRWLAAVLLRRAVRDRARIQGVSSGVLALLDDVDPDASPTRQKRVLERLAEALYDAGLLDLELARPR